jgi:hypothetical protein
MTATIDEIDRINPLDLKAQGEAEMHILHKDAIIRVRSFISGNWDGYTDEELNMIRYGYKTVEEAHAAAIAERDRLATDKLKPSLFRRLMARLLPQR